MTRLYQDDAGNWKDLDEGKKQDWDIQDIKKARELLRVKYSDASCTPETIQAMCDELEKNHRHDPVQIERVIIAHFSKKKK